MCNGYWSRWERRFRERDEEPITFVSDPPGRDEPKEPTEPVAEEREPEKVPAGVAD